MNKLEISHQLRSIAATLAQLRPAADAREKLIFLADIAAEPEEHKKARAMQARIAQLEGQVRTLEAEAVAVAKRSVPETPEQRGSRLKAAKLAILERIGRPPGSNLPNP